MKRSVLPLVLAAMAVGSGSLFSQEEADSETGILPVEPKELWAAMPGKLKTWELTRSTAEKRLTSWIESRAVREYLKIEPEPEPGKEQSNGRGKGKSGGETPAPAKTRIVITDTGKHPAAIGYFSEFSPDAEPEDGVENQLVQSFPSFLIDYGKNEKVQEILVADRFLVEITIENQPPRFLKEWIRRIDFAALAKIPETDPVPLPETLVLMKLDQLNPKKNSAYQLATSSDTRVEAEGREDEEFMRNLVGEIPEIPDSEEPEFE